MNLTPSTFDNFLVFTLKGFSEMDWITVIFFGLLLIAFVVSLYWRIDDAIALLKEIRDLLKNK